MFRFRFLEASHGKVLPLAVLDLRALHPHCRRRRTCLADAMLVSGPKTETSPSVEVIQKVRGKVKDIPVFINIVLNMENTKKLLKVADGAVVVSNLKKERVIRNSLDKERINKLLKVISEIK